MILYPRELHGQMLRDPTNMKSTPSFYTVVVLASAFFFSSLHADVIKLKNGDTLTGRITQEADDFVRIEIPISASIKETKILSRNDILNIVKDAADDVAFNELQKIVPTRSMMNADSYKKMLEMGPNDFLRKYPESRHITKVKEIKSTLESELDKVERGFIKLDEDWISPQERQEFEMLVNSRIRLFRMKSLASARNPNSYVGALREFEAIEENFFGTPAFPEGLQLALQIIPNFGGQLQNLVRDVEFRNAEYERTKEAMTDEGRAQVEAARAREEANYQAGLAADKKQGIKWVRLNPRSKSSLESYLKLASTELKRLQQFDVEGLKKQSELLEQADKLVAEGNLPAARARVTDAMGISIVKEGGKTSKSSKKGSSSYMKTLNEKINAKLAEEAAKAKELEEAAKSRALTKLTSKGEPGTSEKAEDNEKAEEAPADAEKPAEEPKPQQDAFAALAQAEKAKAAEKSSSSSKAKSKSSSEDRKKEEKPEREEEREERPRPSAGGGGGGLPPFLIPGVLVLVLVVAVGLKYLGIGGKKSE